jgi:hypothetical protein
MVKTLILLLFVCGIYQRIAVQPATYLPSDLSFREAAELYYQPYPEMTYGHVTRFGSDDIAYGELYRLAREFRSQYDRGYALLGGGYGYQLIGGMWYLVDNRASNGYTLLANGNAVQYAKLTDGQENLLALGSMSYEEFLDILQYNNTRIISVKSPNDIGREFCLWNLDTNQKVGMVIAGGVAARNDWLYYGPSVNDYYQHPRIGQRVSKYQGTEYYWLADLSDSVWGDGMQYAALLPPEACLCREWGNQ